MLAIKGLSTACHTRNDYRGRSIVDEVRDMNHFNTHMSTLPGVQKKKEYRDDMIALVKVTSMTVSRFRVQACLTSRTRCSFSAHSHLLVDEKKPRHVLLLVPSIAVGVLRI